MAEEAEKAAITLVITNHKTINSDVIKSHMSLSVGLLVEKLQWLKEKCIKMDYACITFNRGIP